MLKKKKCKSQEIRDRNRKTKKTYYIMARKVQIAPLNRIMDNGISQLMGSC